MPHGSPELAPRPIRHVPAPQATETPAETQRLLDLLECDPFTGSEQDDDLTTLLAALTPAPTSRAPVARTVPKTLHTAMHRLVLKTGSPIAQSHMELAVSRWLGWNPASFTPSVQNPTFSGGRARFRKQMGDPRTPSTRTLRELARDAYESYRDTPLAPTSQRALARALAALRTRLAEAASTRRLRLVTAEVAPGEASQAAPTATDHNDSGPPGNVPVNDFLTRRENLRVSPTVEQLTATLALAPGAPSRAVCV